MGVRKKKKAGGNCRVYLTLFLEQQIVQHFFREKKKDHFILYVYHYSNSKKPNKKEILPDLLPYQNP